MEETVIPVVLYIPGGSGFPPSGVWTRFLKIMGPKGTSSDISWFTSHASKKIQKDGSKWLKPPRLKSPKNLNLSIGFLWDTYLQGTNIFYKAIKHIPLIFSQFPLWMAYFQVRTVSFREGIPRLFSTLSILTPQNRLFWGAYPCYTGSFTLPLEGPMILRVTRILRFNPGTAIVPPCFGLCVRIGEPNVLKGWLKWKGCKNPGFSLFQGVATMSKHV